MNPWHSTRQALAVGLFLAAVGIVLPYGHLYLLNTTNLNLPFGVHLPRLALPGLSVTLLATLVQLAVPSRARDAVRAGLLALGIFLWAESTLFIGKYGFFTDGTLDWDANRHLLYLEIALAALLVVLVVRARGLLLRRAGLVMLLLTVSSAANLVEPWRAEQARTRQDVHHTFTRKGLYTLSPERNVLIFILDTYQADVFADIVAGDPAWRTVFDGFTYFPDATSAFPKTYASVPNLLTGTAFDNSRPFATYMRDAYLGDSLPRLLKRDGYDVRYHSFTWQPFLAHMEVADNLAGFDSGDEVRWLRDRDVTLMTNLLTFRLAPYALKPWVYDGGRFRLRSRPDPDPGGGAAPALTDAQRRHSADNDAEDLEYLDEVLAFMDAGSDRPACRVYHLGGAHAPFFLDAGGRYVGPQDYAPGPFRDQSVGVLRIMETVFDRLRKLDAYDGSLIFIVGDHGNGELPTLDIRTDALVRLDGGPEAPVCDDPGLLEVIRGGIPLVLAKPPGAAGPLAVSYAPVELGDLTATAAHLLDLDGDVPGRSLFDPGFDPHRVRLHRYYEFVGWGQDFIVPMTEWRVEGFSWDPSSWSPSTTDMNRKAVTAVQGDMALLGEGGNLEHYPHAGWSAPGPDGRGIVGDAASIVFPVPEDAASMAILVTLKQDWPDPPAPIRIYTDADLAAVIETDGHGLNRFRIFLPDHALTPGSPVEVRFVPEPGTNRETRFVEVRLDHRVERPVWPLGTEVSFAADGSGEEFVNFGWGLPDREGRWSLGTRSALAFGLGRAPRGDLSVRAYFAPALYEGSAPVKVRIVANGETVDEFEATVKKWMEHVFRIPAEVVPANGHLDLDFRVLNPRSPRRYGLNDDSRPLGIWLQSLTIREDGA